MYLCLFQRGWKSGNIDSTGCIHVLVLEREWNFGCIHGSTREGVELWLYSWLGVCVKKGENLAIFTVLAAVFMYLC